MKQIRDLPHYWKLDKSDFITWMVTFLSGILLDIDYGLIIGIITVLFLNTYRCQNLQLKVIGQVRDYEIHKDVKKFLVQEYDSIKIIRPNHSIFYVNCDYFRAELHQVCPLKNNSDTKTVCENCLINYGCLLCCCQRKNSTDSSDVNLDNSNSPHNKNLDETVALKEETKSNKNHRNPSKKYYSAIIVDFSSVSFVDEAGCKCIREVYKEYKGDNIKLLFTNCNECVISFFKKMNCFYGLFDEITFLTVEDATKSMIE